jgi:Xaa-Pro aminopeptidase
MRADSHSKTNPAGTIRLIRLVLAIAAAAGALCLAGCGGGKSDPSIESQFPVVVLDADGIAAVRGAAALGEAGQRAAAAKLREAWAANVTEQQVVDAVKTAVRLAGGDENWCYAPIVATGGDEVLIHGDFSNDATHIVATDTPAFVDLAPRYHGFCADFARTYFFATPTLRMRNAFAAMIATLQSAAATAAPGISTSALYNTMKNALDFNGGFGPNMYPIPGHGLSTVVHSGPLIYPGYYGVLQQNTVLALEPSIFVDNAFRIHIEDDFLITATGALRLTTAPSRIEDMILPRP